MDSAIIRQGELVSRGIMAYETTEEVGFVENLLVDVQQARVVGLSCKTPGLMGRKLAVDWDQLVKIGGDRIIIQTEVPEAVASQLSAAQDITDLEVWTDGGDHIGRVVDICFDQATGEVKQYLYVLKVQEAVTDDEPTAALFGEESSDGEIEALADAAVSSLSESSLSESATEKVTAYKILPAAIISAGRKRMMIAEDAAEKRQPYEQLLDLSPKKPEGDLRTDWRPEKLPEIPTDFNELLQKGQSFAGQVTERVKAQAKKLTDEQLRDREFGEAGTLPDITEQLQERTEQVKEQMQQRLEKARRLA
ncbi:MAG: PRC-barrel domain-containing protein [Phormidesmis sp.]